MPENQKQHSVAWEIYRKLYEEHFFPHEQALQKFCENENNYRIYVEDYYGKQGWVSFQRSFKTEDATNTSMIDIVANLLESQIIIYQKNVKTPNIWDEIYRTTAHASSNNNKIYVQFNGRDHFVALQKNPLYEEGLVKRLNDLSFLNLTIDQNNSNAVQTKVTISLKK